MKKIFVVVAIGLSISLLPGRLVAQDAIVQEGEFGIGVGAAHYFGDFNTRSKVNRP